MYGPDFLQVLVEVGIYGPFRTAFEVLDEERAVAADATHESEVLAVGGRGRPHCTACTRHVTLGLARLEIVTANLEDLTI